MLYRAVQILVCQHQGQKYRQQSFIYSDSPPIILNLSSYVQVFTCADGSLAPLLSMLDGVPHLPIDTSGCLQRRL